MTDRAPRGLPWWPVHVDADIEPDGLRITGSQAAVVLPPGSLIRWDRFSSDGLLRCRDDSGRTVRVGRRRVALRIDHQGRRRQRDEIPRTAIAWFSAPERRYRTTTRPGRRQRASVQVGSLLVLGIGLIGFALWSAGRPIPTLGDSSGEVGRRADLASGGFVLLCAAGFISMVMVAAKEFCTIHRGWWIEELDDLGVRMQSRQRVDHATWEQLRTFRHRFSKIEIRTDDGRRVYLEPTRPAIWAVRARLKEHAPLWSAMFVATLVAAVAGPLGLALIWQWLELPATFGAPQVIFLQCFMLVFPGLLAINWWTVRRTARTETPSADPE
jgi:hypothetical protein